MFVIYYFIFTIYFIFLKLSFLLKQIRVSSYHGIAPGSIPGDGKNVGLPINPADIVMNRELVSLNKAK